MDIVDHKYITNKMNIVDNICIMNKYNNYKSIHRHVDRFYNMSYFITKNKINAHISKIAKQYKKYLNQLSVSIAISCINNKIKIRPIYYRMLPNDIMKLIIHAINNNFCEILVGVYDYVDKSLIKQHIIIDLHVNHHFFNKFSHGNINVIKYLHKDLSFTKYIFHINIMEYL